MISPEGHVVSVRKDVGIRQRHINGVQILDGFWRLAFRVAMVFAGTVSSPRALGAWGPQCYEGLVADPPIIGTNKSICVWHLGIITHFPYFGIYRTLSNHICCFQK